jgi:acyl carrier protein
MNDHKERLARCFEILFPQLSREEIYRATQDSVKEWDSVAAITLLNVIEDEFQIQIDFEVLADLSSFDAIIEHLNSHAGVPGQGA